MLLCSKIICVSNILYSKIPRELVNLCMKYRYKKTTLRRLRFYIN